MTTVPGDMFTEMRCAFSAERWRSNDSVWQSEEPLPSDALTARDMLTMATLDGAHVAGLEARTGSLTPGKQADVVVIDGSAPGTAPIVDPIATVVLAADTVERRHRDHRWADPQAEREAHGRLGLRAEEG